MKSTEVNRSNSFSKLLWFLGGFAVATIVIAAGLFSLGKHLYDQEATQRSAALDPYRLLAACHAGELINPHQGSSQTQSLKSDQDILVWVQTVTPDLVAFDFNNASEKLTSQQKNFTSKGWCEFIKAMVESHMLEAVSSRKLAVSTNLLGGAEIKDKAQSNGFDVWHVQIPVSLTFHTAAKDGETAPTPVIGKLVLTVENRDLQAKEGPLISQYLLMPKAK